MSHVQAQETYEQRVIRQLEDQVVRLISAESALLRITDVLGIVVEVRDDGCYDALALRDQVIDAIERRQAGGSV